MKSLVFKYKKFNYFFVFFINCLIPTLLLFLQLNTDKCFKFEISNKIGSIKVTDLIGAIVLCLFLFFFISYLLTTLKNNRKAFSVLKNVEGNFKRFWIGITSTFIAWNLSIILIAIRLLVSNFDLAIQIVTYLFVVINFFLGVFSNIYLSMFEFKWNFDIFYLRYKDSVISKVLSANPNS